MLSRNAVFQRPFGAARGLAPTRSQRYTSASPQPDPTMIQLLVYLLTFISYLIQLYVYVVIAGVILSWLMAFGVMNPYNPTVRGIWQAINAVTEPLLRPIRNALPNLGAIDISPIVLLLGCFFVQGLIGQVLIPLIVGA